MSLAKTLLAGAAVCALCAPAALARQAPNIHLAGVDTALKMKVGAPLHFKSVPGLQTAQNFTETVTFTGTLSKAADFKTKIILLGETWYSSTSCTQPTKQKWVLPSKTTPNAKLSTGTGTGTIAGCGTTVFTFQDIDYELMNKKATSDTVTGALIAKKFQGYNLTLNAIVDLTIGA